MLGLLLGLPGVSRGAITIEEQLLPSTFERTGDRLASRRKAWTYRDLIEPRWITDTALSADGEQTAFIVKQSFVDSGLTRYALYVLPTKARRSIARKIVEVSYLGELSVHPGTYRWSARADLGRGVQLYDFDSSGAAHPIVHNQGTALVGSWEGVVAGFDSPQQVGVMSYQWNEEGSRLWYSRLRLRTPQELQQATEGGIVYDDLTMNAQTVRNFPGLLLGTELRVLDVAAASDRLLAFAPSIASADLGAFSRWARSAEWAADSRTVHYTLDHIRPDGQWETSAVMVDSVSGHESRLAPELAGKALTSLPQGAGYLNVDTARHPAHLLHLSLTGKLIRDLGAVAFGMIFQAYGLSDWTAGHSGKGMLEVQYPDRDGLFLLNGKSSASALQRIPENLSRCSFNKPLTLGICARESLTGGPELVSISPADGELRVLARPNAGYEEIAPLTFKPARWQNRYGSETDGYITFPRRYVAGKRYPAVVLTHGRDAKNQFARQGFQWDFPLQVFAEQGFVVISVNEPELQFDSRTLPGDHSDEVGAMQMSVGLEAVATMETALQSLIDSGLVDPDKTGISGYSRGSEVANYVMSHSRIFKAASIGDSGTSDDAYWSWGTEFGRRWHTAVYGGSPYDSNPKILENHRRFSPSFRASQFAGPLLQVFPLASVRLGLELNRLLQDAAVPVELVLFPNESHLFWNPRHRARVMEMNLDWFNFWLLNRRDTDPEKAAQFLRWQALKTSRSGRSGP